MDISLGAKKTESSEGKIYKALDTLKANPEIIDWDYCECESPCSAGHGYIPMSVQDAITDLLDNVPKLLEAYAGLWELSMNLAAAWEQERAGITPTGLVLPK